MVKASLHSVAGVSLTLGRTGSFVASLLPLSCLSWERERGVVARPQTSSFVRFHFAHQNCCIVYRNCNTERWPLSCLSWERERGVVTRPQTSSFVRIHLAHQNCCILHRNYNTERQEAFDKIVNINVFSPFLSETTTKGDQSQCQSPTYTDAMMHVLELFTIQETSARTSVRIALLTLRKSDNKIHRYSYSSKVGIN